MSSYDRSIDVDLDDLDGRDAVRAVLDCTGGWYAQDWSGIRLDHLLERTAGRSRAAAASMSSP